MHADKKTKLKNVGASYIKNIIQSTNYPIEIINTSEDDLIFYINGERFLQKIKIINKRTVLDEISDKTTSVDILFDITSYSIYFKLRENRWRRVKNKQEILDVLNNLKNHDNYDLYGIDLPI
jgi:hypothetical protein